MKRLKNIRRNKYEKGGYGFDGGFRNDDWIVCL